MDKKGGKRRKGSGKGRKIREGSIDMNSSLLNWRYFLVLGLSDLSVPPYAPLIK